MKNAIFFGMIFCIISLSGCRGATPPPAASTTPVVTPVDPRVTTLIDEQAKLITEQGELIKKLQGELESAKADLMTKDGLIDARIAALEGVVEGKAQNSRVDAVEKVVNRAFDVASQALATVNNQNGRIDDLTGRMNADDSRHAQLATDLKKIMDDIAAANTRISDQVAAMNAVTETAKLALTQSNEAKLAVEELRKQMELLTAEISEVQKALVVLPQMQAQLNCHEGKLNWLYEQHRRIAEALRALNCADLSLDARLQKVEDILSRPPANPYPLPSPVYQPPAPRKVPCR